MHVPGSSRAVPYMERTDGGSAASASAKGEAALPAELCAKAYPRRLAPLPKERPPRLPKNFAQRRIRVASRLAPLPKERTPGIRVEAGRFRPRTARAPAPRIRDHGRLTESLHMVLNPSRGRRGSPNGGARRKRHLSPRTSRVAPTSESANPTFQKWLRLVAIPERPAARGPLTGARGLAWALAWKA